MASDCDSESSSEMDILEMTECLLHDFLISSSSDCNDIVSDESDDYSENETTMNMNHVPDNDEHNNKIDNVLNAACGILTSTENVTREQRTGNRQAIGPDPAGDCVAVTKGKLKVCDCVRNMCDDVQWCGSHNQDPTDLHHLVDTGSSVCNLDPSDTQHSVDTGEKVGNLDHIDLKQSLNTGEKVWNLDPSDLQHLVDTDEKMGNLDRSDLLHLVDTDEKMGNLDPSDLHYLMDTGKNMGNLDLSDLQHSVNTSEKMGYLDPSDFLHSVDNSEKVGKLYIKCDNSMDDSQKDFGASEEESRHPNLCDIFKEWVGFCTKDNNQQKQYCERVRSELSEAVIPIAKSVLNLCIAQPKNSADSNDRQHLPESDNKEASSELNYGLIAMALLQPFRSKGENENEEDKKTEKSAKEQEKRRASTENENNGLITWIDGIYELIEFYCEIKASDEDRTADNSTRKYTKWTRAADNDGNTDCEKDTNKPQVTIWPDVARDVITDLMKVCLWFYGGCQEVAPDSYKADDVVLCSDGSFSINDLLIAFKGSVSHSGIEQLKYLAKCFHLVFLNVWLKVINLWLVLSESVLSSNSETESNIRTQSENEPSSDLFQFLNWINDNSSYLTNIECTYTDAILPNIVNWVSSWAYSIMISTDEFDMFDGRLKRFVQGYKLLAIFSFIPIIWFDFQVDLITGLKSICEVCPYLEYFLRNILRIFLSWALWFFSKTISLTEKTCTFGRRLVKKVSIVELLCFLHQEKPLKDYISSKDTELLEIIRKLSDVFQIGNISSRMQPDLFHYEQHDDSVLTQTADVECKSVVDMLWLRYEDTLSESNYSNAVTDVTKMLGLFIDDLRKFVFPEIAEISETVQFVKGVFIPVLSGSRLDGCVSLLFGPGNDCDFDIMAPIFRSDNYIMERVPDRPTSVLFIKTVPGIYSSGPSSFKKYLSPLDVKNDMSNTFSLVGPFSLMFLPFHILFNIPYSFQLGDVAGTLLLFQGEDNVIISIDWVPAVVIDTWPDQAQNWIHRNNDWPVFEMRKSISIGGCHAVAKTPTRGDPDKEWRLSFSKAENTLCKIFTLSQAFHLSLLKTQFKSVKSKIGTCKVRIFKNYTITKGMFHTYHAKTAMFWFCENHPPEDDIWRKENVFRCQSELLERMEEMMQRGNIPHYFIPEQNLLEGIPGEFLQQAMTELSILKHEARTGDGRVYQEIIKQPPHEDHFLNLSQR